jgi:hypothetical protein
VPAEVVAVPPHKRTPRVEPEAFIAATLRVVEERVFEEPRDTQRLDTLDRIRAALARLEEPPVEEAVIAGESRVVLEESP